MKKFVKALSLTLVLAMLALSLAACGNKTLSGKYVSDDIDFVVGTYSASYEFEGNKVTIVKDVDMRVGQDPDPITFNGTYEIVEEDDGDLKIKLTLDGAEEDEHIKAGTYALEQGEDYIKIGLIKYTKAVAYKAI